MSRDDLVERVARAIAEYEAVTSCKALGLEPQPLYADSWTKQVGRARAAIEAISPKQATQGDMAGAAERALRITVWNFLCERGVKQEACYPIIEGAATSFRAALAQGEGDTP